MKNQFNPIFDECDNEDCKGSCEDPSQCQKKSPWSDNFKLYAFFGILLTAISMSAYTITKNGVNSEVIAELPLSKGDKSLPADKNAVDFVYMFSNVELENEANLSNLYDALNKIRNSGGGVRLHVLERKHEHFATVSALYKIDSFPSVIILGPSCCSKFIMKENFTTDRFIDAYKVARASADPESKEGDASCDSKSCK